MIQKGVLRMVTTRWSLLPEYYSLFLLVIIMTRYFGHERHVALTAKRKLFFCRKTACA